MVIGVGCSAWRCIQHPNTPPQGKVNLFKKQVKLASYGPMFCDITWGAGGSTADATLDIATSMQTKVGDEKRCVIIREGSGDSMMPCSSACQRWVSRAKARLTRTRPHDL